MTTDGAGYPYAWGRPRWGDFKGTHCAPARTCSTWRPLSGGSSPPAKHSPNAAESKGRACLAPACLPTQGRQPGNSTALTNGTWGSSVARGKVRTGQGAAAHQQRSAPTSRSRCAGWLEKFCTLWHSSPPARPPPPPPQQPAPPRYLLVEPKAQRHSLAPLLIVALGAVEVFAEFGERHAGFPVRVEHVGWGQHYEGICDRTWDRTRRRSGFSKNREDNVRRRQLPGLLPSSPAPGKGQSPSPCPWCRGAGTWLRSLGPAGRSGAARPSSAEPAIHQRLPLSQLLLQ